MQDNYRCHLIHHNFYYLPAKETQKRLVKATTVKKKLIFPPKWMIDKTKIYKDVENFYLNPNRPILYDRYI